MTKLSRILFSLGLVALLAACGNSAPDGNGSPANPLSIGISATPETVEAGGSVNLSATIGGDGAGNSTVTWAADDNAGSFSSDTGVNVSWTSPAKAGTYTITATVSANGTSKSAGVAIEVTAAASEPGEPTGPGADPLSVELTGAAQSTVFGATVVLTAEVTGDGADDAELNWQVDRGALAVNPAGRQATFTPPAVEDTFTIGVEVVDGTARDSFDVEVTLCNDGSATDPRNPCTISNVVQLQALADYRNGHFALAGDIDAAVTSGWDENAGFSPIGDEDNPFSGSFNGNNHAISNLFINRPDSARVGLFGVLSAGSEVSDLNLVDVAISGSDTNATDRYTGALAGEHRGFMANVTASGTVASSTVTGGLVGWSNGGSIEDSVNNSSVTGGRSVGGIAGQTSHAEVSNSENTGPITGTHENTGGLIGHNGTGSTINNGLNHGAVQGTSQVGGLIGHNGTRGTINNGLNHGAVQGTSQVGGLVGLNHGTVADSSSLAPVTATGSNSGGLVGSNGDRDGAGTITRSHAASPLVSNVISSGTGTSNNGGLAGINFGTISDSHSASTVESTAPNTGGLVGYNQGGALIERSYTTSIVDVSGTHSVGGLVGINWGSITQSYSLANRAEASHNRAGGLVGYNQASALHTGSVTESYSMTAVSAPTNPGGLIGENNDAPTGGGSPAVVETSLWDMQISGHDVSGGGVGVPGTVLMLQEVTFTDLGAGWDFSHDWQIEEGRGPPDLRSNPRQLP